MAHSKSTGHKSRNGHTSSVIKRSIVLNGHKTSVSLEEPFWLEVKRIALEQETTLSDLVSGIDDTRTKNKQGNLSSALRLFVLSHVQAEAA
jgi:predicted DNA-binding ribbon-helix-helix protein